MDWLIARYSLLYALNYARPIGTALLPETYSSSLIIHEYINALIILVQWARNCLQDFDNSELQVDCDHKLIVSTPRFEQKCEINRPLKVLSAQSIYGVSVGLASCSFSSRYESSAVSTQLPE